MYETYYDNYGRVVENDKQAVIKRVDKEKHSFFKLKQKTGGGFYRRGDIIKRDIVWISISQSSFEDLMKYYSEGGEYRFNRVVNRLWA